MSSKEVPTLPGDEPRKKLKICIFSLLAALTLGLLIFSIYQEYRYYTGQAEEIAELQKQNDGLRTLLYKQLAKTNEKLEDLEDGQDDLEGAILAKKTKATK